MVIGIQRQHALCQRIHHILARRLHNDIARKGRRQCAAAPHQRAEILKLLPVRQLTEKQQIDRFLIAETVVTDKSVDKILDMIAAEQQLPFTELRLAVLLGAGDDLADIGQSGADALAVDITQTALDVIF